MGIQQTIFMKLNFGCGYRKKKGYLNVDMADSDKDFDFKEYPYPFKDNTFDEIYTHHTLCNLEDYFGVMRELYRIAKPNALIHIIEPFYNSSTAFIPTNKTKFSYSNISCLVFPKKKLSETPQNKIALGNIKLEIISFKIIPSIFLKFVPDIKFKNKHIGLRYTIGTVLGNTIKKLDIKLKVIKFNTP